MKKYFIPIVEIIQWKQEDIIVTSPGYADFDDIFDDSNWK